MFVTKQVRLISMTYDHVRVRVYARVNVHVTVCVSFMVGSTDTRTFQRTTEVMPSSDCSYVRTVQESPS